MNVPAELVRQLQELAANPPDGALPDLSVSAPEGHLLLVLAAVDSLGCAFHRLTWRTDRLQQASSQQLKQLGEYLAQRLQYLLEPIHLVEVDPVEPAVQLRSAPPQQDSTGRTYYEVLATTGGEISLCRYRKVPGQARQAVPATVTHEVVRRLVQDVVESVGQE